MHRPRSKALDLNPETGASRIPFLLLLGLITLSVYLAAMIIPPYINNQSLTTAAEEIVKRGALQKLSDADVLAQLKEKAREYGVPDEHDIKLWHEGQGLAASIRYTHQIRFPFYTHPWPVDIRVKNVGF
jgi:hypothetical protein